jgi:hypothetical protein
MLESYKIVIYPKILLILFLLLALQAIAQDVSDIPTGQSGIIHADQICSSNNSMFVGSCFRLHARLEAGADNIMVWIWPVGTKRMLGYAGKALVCDLPKNITPFLSANKTIYTDIIVRPVSKSMPGYMQFVCIASATHLVIRNEPL